MKQAINVDATEIKPVIEDLNNAFAAFKQEHVGKVATLQASVDEMAIKLAARPSNSGCGVTIQTAGPVHAAAGLRGRDAIHEHYLLRAADRDEAREINVADFFRGVAGLKTSTEVRASLSSGADADGGYSLPSAAMPHILDAMAEQSALLKAGASVLPLDYGAKSYTQAAIDTLPTPAWRAELGAVAESAPTFRGVVSAPKSLSVIVRISRELLADAPDVARVLTTALVQAYSAELDRVALVGTGTSPEPRGIFSTTGVHLIAQAGAAFGFADMLAGYGAILDAKGPAPTACIVAPRTLIGLAGAKDTTGQPLNPPALLANVQQLPTVGVPTNLGAGTNESLAFIGDFRTVQFVVRESISVRPLAEAYAKTGEIGFACHLRADVAVNYPGALSVVTGVV